MELAMNDESDIQSQKPLRQRVEAVIDVLRPILQGDGGDLELVDVSDDGVVSVRLHGACVGCPSADMTLTMGIERNLKDQIPEVTRVVSV
jgi:Fe-S cluster biogenesis protein NfuA